MDNIFALWENLGGTLVSKYTFPAPDASVKHEDRTISAPQGHDIKIRIYTPEGYKDGSKPLGLFIHGGGWAMGDLDSDDANARVISKGAGAVIVSVDYRLAPQHKYPAAHDDCHTAFTWALSHGKELGAKEGPAFIAGASAGGGTALGLALRLIDEGKGDQVKGVIAQVPVTVHPAAVPEDLRSRYTSFDEHAEHTVNGSHAMMAFLDAYGASPKDKQVSVLLHPKTGALPNVYITAAGHDTLRDDARLMREQLETNGVEVKYDEYEGLPHYFWTFPSGKLDEVRNDYVQKLVRGTQWVLE